MKRRQTQEHEQADARDRAEEHRQALLAELKARELARRAPADDPEPAVAATEPEVAAEESEQTEPDAAP